MVGIYRRYLNFFLKCIFCQAKNLDLFSRGFKFSILFSFSLSLSLLFNVLPFARVASHSSRVTVPIFKHHHTAVFGIFQFSSTFFDRVIDFSASGRRKYYFSPVFARKPGKFWEIFGILRRNFWKLGHVRRAFFE